MHKKTAPVVGVAALSVEGCHYHQRSFLVHSPVPGVSINRHIIQWSVENETVIVTWFGVENKAHAGQSQCFGFFNRENFRTLLHNRRYSFENLARFSHLTVCNVLFAVY